MNQDLLNFWKNYENVINWGYRISGEQEVDVCESTVPIKMQTSVCTLFVILPLEIIISTIDVPLSFNFSIVLIQWSY